MSKQIQQIFEKKQQIVREMRKTCFHIDAVQISPRVFAPNWDCESCDSSPAQSIIAADPPAAYGTLHPA